jgi:hypothetical protein
MSRGWGKEEELRMYKKDAYRADPRGIALGVE